MITNGECNLCRKIRRILKDHPNPLGYNIDELVEHIEWLHDINGVRKG